MMKFDVDKYAKELRDDLITLGESEMAKKIDEKFLEKLHQFRGTTIEEAIDFLMRNRYYEIAVGYHLDVYYAAHNYLIAETDEVLVKAGTE